MKNKNKNSSTTPMTKINMMKSIFKVRLKSRYLDKFQVMSMMKMYNEIKTKKIAVKKDHLNSMRIQFQV